MRCSELDLLVLDDIQKYFQQLDVSQQRGLQLLHELVAASKLVRVAKGVYASPGVDLHPYAVACALVKPSAIAFESALEHYGLKSPQLERVICATPMYTRRERKIGATTIQYCWHRFGTFFGYTMQKVAPGQSFLVSDRERTILDCFARAGMQRCGGIRGATRVLRALLRGTDLDRLAHYVYCFGDASIAARLGYSLHHAGISTRKLQAFYEMRPQSFAPLDPTRPRSGGYEWRWGVLDNVGWD